MLSYFSDAAVLEGATGPEPFASARLDARLERKFAQQRQTESVDG